MEPVYKFMSDYDFDIEDDAKLDQTTGSKITLLQSYIRCGVGVLGKIKDINSGNLRINVFANSLK